MHPHSRKLNASYWKFKDNIIKRHSHSFAYEDSINRLEIISRGPLQQLARLVAVINRIQTQRNLLKYCHHFLFFLENCDYFLLAFLAQKIYLNCPTSAPCISKRKRGGKKRGRKKSQPSKPEGKQHFLWAYNLTLKLAKQIQVTKNTKSLISTFITSMWKHIVYGSCKNRLFISYRI